MVTTDSGLQYKDIKVGEGPSPPIGFQERKTYSTLIQLLAVHFYVKEEKQSVFRNNRTHLIMSDILNIRLSKC